MPGDIGRQLLNSGTLTALATFDGQYEFIVDLFRGGAGYQLTAFCCKAVATGSQEAKSIGLCQAAVLAGYTPSAEELQRSQLTAASQTTAGRLIEELVNWLNEDKQQVPSLLRQCRVAIRRQLSVVAHFQTILPAIEQLPLPANLKLYLQFDGILSEVNLSVNQELTASETTEETSLENRRQLLSSYTAYRAYSFYEFLHYLHSSYDSDDDFHYYGRDSDDESMYDWW